jgi:CRISPR system Cascade subunit CasC
MSLFVEFHLIQNFAPSNLNRDDTGAPKDAIFGGHRRARVSSQCFKRAIRLNAADGAAIPTEYTGVRTKKLKHLLVSRLAELGREECGAKVDEALAGAGLKLKDDGDTEYLLFLGRGEVEDFAQLINKYWDALGNAPVVEGKRSKKEAKAIVGRYAGG